MNERIKELAREAGIDDVLTPETAIDQFALLIVRECIDAACEAQADFYVVHNIKTRFGVEENKA